MARESDPSDRILLKSRGELNHPGSCMVCGGSDEERNYVDLGVFYDYEGNCYLCDLCGTQVGEVLGLFTPDEIKDLVKQGNDLAAANEAMRKELDHARPIVDAIRGLGLADSSTVGLSAALSNDSHEELQGAGETPADVTESAVSGEPEITEHHGKSGRSDANGNESGNGSSAKVTPKRRTFQ